MPRVRLPLHALLPVALGALVVALATLQYRWLGQVSDAERQEMRASLERRSRDFATDFDRELGTLYAALAETGDTNGKPSGATIARALAAWKISARFPAMVHAVYATRASGPHDTIDYYDAASEQLQPVPWPVVLNPVLRRFDTDTVARGDRRTPTFERVVALGGPPVVSGIPALVIWLPDGPALPDDEPLLPLAQSAFGTSPNRPATLTDRHPSSETLSKRFDVLVRAPLADRVLIAQLDRAYIVNTVLPRLADRHFGTDEPTASPTPETAGSARQPTTLHGRLPLVRLQVVDAANVPVFTHGLGANEPIAADRADVSTPFFHPRMDATQWVPGDRVISWAFEKPADVDSRVTMRVERTEVVGPASRSGAAESWQLRLQHSAGSLDQAVANARRRNLYLSFGILSVLVGAVGLVLVNARRAQRLAAQQMEFVATVSHELRTPLSVIRSAAENITAGIVRDPAQTRQYGQLIETEGRRLTDMVEHVLSQAGINSASRRPRAGPVDVHDTLRAVVEATASPAAAAGCTVEVDVQEDVPPVLADDASLRGAVENLVINALKHASEGRWVGIRARRVDGSTGVFSDRRGSHRLVHGVEIAVTDRGAGVDSRDLGQIFDPFYRGRTALDRQIQGSGLGLSLVKRTVEDLGGRVSVERTPEGGARFVLVLPAADSLGGVDEPRT